MSIPTLAPASLGDDTPLDRDAHAAGIADAYDEHAAGTPTLFLQGRLEHLTTHLPDVSDTYAAYVLGYASAVLSIHLFEQATTDAQTQIAFEDQENHR